MLVCVQSMMRATKAQLASIPTEASISANNAPAGS